MYSDVRLGFESRLCYEEVTGPYASWSFSCSCLRWSLWENFFNRDDKKTWWYHVHKALSMVPSNVDKEMEANISWALLPCLHYECQAWPSLRALALSSTVPDNLELDHSHLKAKLLITFSQKKVKTYCREKSNLEEQINTRLGLHDVLGLLWGRFPSKRIILPWKK